LKRNDKYSVFFCYNDKYSLMYYCNKKSLMYYRKKAKIPTNDFLFLFS